VSDPGAVQRAGGAIDPVRRGQFLRPGRLAIELSLELRRRDDIHQRLAAAHLRGSRNLQRIAAGAGQRRIVQHGLHDRDGHRRSNSYADANGYAHTDTDPDPDAQCQLAADFPVRPVRQPQLRRREHDHAGKLLPAAVQPDDLRHEQPVRVRARLQLRPGRECDFGCRRATIHYDAENKQTQVKDVNNAVIGTYSYDGDGKRVKKVATTETTVFVYDALGRSVEEYSGSTLQTAYVYAGSRLLAIENQTGTSYLTSDHLGSPRINTDGSGNVTARHDYMPFGEEIFSVGGRIAGLGYNSDNVRKKFTGYERDGETGMDFAQARYFDSGYGRFSSPDSFTNATHASEPQSWNLYSYVRNNPMNLVDPLGEKAEISSCYDEKTKTTIIKIRASFSVYAANGQKLSRTEVKNYADMLKKGIEKEYGKSFTIDGQKYVMSAEVNVQTAANEKEAVASGADNLVELGTQTIKDDDNQETLAGVFHREGESFDRMMVHVGAMGLGFQPWDYGTTFAHEFGHLLGVKDKDRSGLFLSGNPSEMTEDDFRDLFGERPNGSNYITPLPVAGSDKFTWLPTTTSSKIIGSTVSNFETRRSYGPDVFKWVQTVKK